MGSVIEFLYTGEYFPKKTSSARDAPLEKDPCRPVPDDDGAGLLVHARVYTLAERLGLPDLKSLAHSKIHRTASTAKGELAYARFVYKESSPDDQTIRKPVAAFWATRSYSLACATTQNQSSEPCVSSFLNFRTMFFNWCLTSRRRAGGGPAMMGLVEVDPV